MKEREQWLDNAKGFACFLVVYCHVVRGIINAGIVSSNIILEYLDYAIYLFHMPLFFMVSGYLYKVSTKITGIKEYFKFVGKKILNLGIPYMVFSIIFILLNFFTIGTNSDYSLMDIVNLYKTPIGHFWFLYDLIIIFILMPIIEKIIKDERILLFILLFVKIFINVLNIDIFILSRFFEYAFYFFIGRYVVDNIKKKQDKMILSSMIFLIVSILVFGFFDKGQYRIIQVVIETLLAVVGCFATLAIIKKKNNKIFDILGEFSFQIYLMHTIFSACTRIVLVKIGIDNFFIHLILGIGIGIILPIIISFISNKIIYTNILIFPLKTFKMLRNKKA